MPEPTRASWGGEEKKNNRVPGKRRGVVLTPMGSSEDRFRTTRSSLLLVLLFEMKGNTKRGHGWRTWHTGEYVHKKIKKSQDDRVPRRARAPRCTAGHVAHEPPCARKAGKIKKIKPESSVLPTQRLDIDRHARHHSMMRTGIVGQWSVCPLLGVAVAHPHTADGHRPACKTPLKCHPQQRFIY